MKRIFIFTAVLFLIVSFSTPALSHQVEDDNTLNPIKLAAYAAYPAGLALDIFVVKPVHWLFNLPVMKTITGHQRINEEGLWTDKELDREIEEIKK
ncbi:MAG: hypothetical protein D6734_02440 [Candidatus Schekmanbacteria bacterium]|nr:MAG: hypothetical protein D6734_02440 [Candidatus Schekmanbacteria bacterium]